MPFECHPPHGPVIMMTKQKQSFSISSTFKNLKLRFALLKIKLHSQYYIHAIYLMPSGNALIVLVAKFSQKVKFENEVILEAFIQ
jgi:hypothetical protein